MNLIVLVKHAGSGSIRILPLKKEPEKYWFKMGSMKFLKSI